MLYVKAWGDLDIEVYRRPTHADQYILFDIYLLLEHKLGVTATLQQWAKMIKVNTDSKDKEQRHVRNAFGSLWLHRLGFFKRITRSRKNKDLQIEGRSRTRGLN